MASKTLQTLVVDDAPVAQRILLEELSLVDGVTEVGVVSRRRAPMIDEVLGCGK